MTIIAYLGFLRFKEAEKINFSTTFNFRKCIIFAAQNIILNQFK